MAERRHLLPGAGSPGSLGVRPTPPLTRHPSEEGKRKYPLLGGVVLSLSQGRGGVLRTAGWIFLRIARRFLRNTRGAAALESAVGAAVLVTTSTLAFDLYTRATATTTGLNVAVAMADYVSREKKPKASEIAALATFLHGEFFPQADTAFVVVAVQGATGENQQWTWTRQILSDTNASPDPDLATCSQVAGAEKKATPPTALALEADEIVIVAEVCVKQAGGISYYHHILPTRSEKVPLLQS